MTHYQLGKDNSYKMKVLILFSVFAFVLGTGQWKEVPKDTDEVFKAANFAVQSLSMRMNSPFHAKLARLHRAEKQVW